METMRPIPVSRALAAAMATLLGAVALLLAGPAVARAATLTIEIRSGIGTVDIVGGGLSCRRDAGDPLPRICTIAVGDGDQLTLQAAPGPDHRFFQWSADNVDCHRQPTCFVDVAAQDRTVLAGFAPVRTLNILPIGEGVVTVSPPAVDLTAGFEPTDFCDTSAESVDSETGMGGCRFSYLPGTTVTLAGVPRFISDELGTSRLAHWSPVECPGLDPCTVTVGDEDVTVGAMFDPLQLGVKIAGVGSLAIAPPGDPPGDATSQDTCTAPPAGDPVTDCFLYYPSGTPVTLTPTTPGAQWVVGCLAVSPDGPTCTTLVDRYPWWVGVSFGGAPLGPEAFPPKIRVRFRVTVMGSGDGSVHGDRIECGTQCSNTYDYGDLERLRVDPAAGSRFDHWEGGCGTDPTCTLPVGRVTTVRAVFSRTAQDDGGNNNGGNRNDDRGTPRRLSARRVRLAASGRGKRRRVVLVVAVNESASGRLRLLRGRRQVAARTYRLRAGRNRLVLKVPRRARRGKHRVVLTVRAPSGRRTVSGTVRLRR
jgi:hypothetical protein